MSRQTQNLGFAKHFGPYERSASERAKPAHQPGIMFLEWWPTLAANAAIVLGLAISVWPTEETRVLGHTVPLRFVLLICVVVLMAIGWWGSLGGKRSLDLAEKRIKELTQQKQQYEKDTAAVFHAVLTQLAIDCDLVNSEGHCESSIRLTIYYHPENESIFVPVARIAGNPKYKVQGRTSYPDNQGVISQGWELGAARLKVSADTPEQWVRAMTDQSAVPADVAKKLSMQSMSYLALRLDYGGHSVGVAVIESTQKTKADASLERKVKESVAFKPIASLVDAVRESHLSGLVENASK